MHCIMRGIEIPIESEKSMKRTTSNSVGRQERSDRRERFNRRLLGYSASAGAALAVAGTASTANAAIQYDLGFTGPITVSSANPTVSIDLTGGLIAPAFSVNWSGFSKKASTNLANPGWTYFKRAIHIAPKAAGAGAFASVAPVSIATNLPMGFVIGSGGRFSATKLGSIRHMNTVVNPPGGRNSSGTWFGEFFSVFGPPGYIGVKFNVGDQTDYGWIDFGESADGSVGTIYGWAYDDSGGPMAAGAPIPEPTSLAVWALGALAAAVGTGALRRWKKEA
jgi:hypothetical protein